MCCRSDYGESLGRNFYLNPTKEDFKTHAMQLQQRASVIENSQASVSSGYRVEKSAIIERRDNHLQEAMQRDQYLLSTRQNRHVVFAAKYARTKNFGLAKVLEKNVRLWSREHDRSLRQVKDYRNRLSRDLEALRERGMRNRQQLQHLEQKAVKYYNMDDPNVFPPIAQNSGRGQATSGHIDLRGNIEYNLKSRTNNWKARVHKTVSITTTLPPL